MTTILIVILILLLLGALPNTGWHSFGYGPSGILGVVVIVLLVLLLLGKV